MSSRSVPTTIIGPKGLFRDSLASLLGGYSYRVTDSHDTAADMPAPSEKDTVRMVLLTACTVDLAMAECVTARRICQNCKIVAVLEHLQDEDFQKLAHSAIDGSVPLDVSQDVLTRTLDLVMSGSERIIVLADDPCSSISPAADGQRKTDPGTRPSSGGPCPRELPEKGSASITNQHVAPLVPNAKACSVSKAVSESSTVCGSTISVSTENHNSDTQRLNGHLGRLSPGLNGHHADGLEREQPVAAARSGDLPPTATSPALSERERQIIDGLIKGQSNKTIARACGITEATVKVHMKAILRKLPCSNRTQVAIWARALEHALEHAMPSTPHR